MDMTPPCFPVTNSQLDPHNDFVGRHIGPDEAETRAMLGTLGLESLDELIDKTIPASIRSSSPISLPAGHSEPDTLDTLREIAAKNRVFRSFIGAGYHDCHPQMIEVVLTRAEPLGPKVVVGDPATEHNPARIQRNRPLCPARPHARPCTADDSNLVFTYAPTTTGQQNVLSGTTH